MKINKRLIKKALKDSKQITLELNGAYLHSVVQAEKLLTKKKLTQKDLKTIVQAIAETDLVTSNLKPAYSLISVLTAMRYILDNFDTVDL